MFIKRKTRAGKTYAYRMLLSFETSLTCNFFFNYTPNKCVLCEGVIVGNNSTFIGHYPISDVNIQASTVAKFGHVKSRFRFVLQFLL